MKILSFGQSQPWPFSEERGCVCGTRWVLEPGDPFTMTDQGSVYELDCPVCGKLNQCFEAFPGTCNHIYRKGERPSDTPRREVRLICSTCQKEYIGKRAMKAGQAGFCPSCKADRDREAKRQWASNNRNRKAGV